jgi:tRNA(Ile)-lysidine synthase
MPLLQRRWPAATRTISRAARWQAEAAALLADQADADLDAVSACDSDGLSIERLLALSPANRSAVLRVWVARRGFPPPDADQLIELGAALNARPDANPCVSWPGVEVRRHRDVLMIMAPLPRPDPGMVVEWLPAEGPLRLPFGLLSIDASPDSLEPAPRSYSVRYRRGGEHCRMTPGGPTRPVKHLLQEWGIPTWLRAGLPLVYSGELLVALGDRTTADAAPGLALRWDWLDGVGAPAGFRTATRRGS